MGRYRGLVFRRAPSASSGYTRHSDVPARTCFSRSLRHPEQMPPPRRRGAAQRQGPHEQIQIAGAGGKRQVFLARYRVSAVLPDQGPQGKSRGPQLCRAGVGRRSGRPCRRYRVSITATRRMYTMMALVAAELLGLSREWATLLLASDVPEMASAGSIFRTTS